jgi:tetratricopeptide (TPR) repeat protein
MGASGSKSVEVKSKRQLERDELYANSASDKVETLTDMEQYSAFREQLFKFSLGEAAYDYAERLYAENPDSPEIMALLGETTYMYEKVKNPTMREHWIDRLDILQRGIDVSRKCFKKYPEYGPCYRTYTLNAVKASDQFFFYKDYYNSLGVAKHYSGILSKGKKALEMNPTADVAMSLGALHARAAFAPTSPFRPFAMWFGVPPQQEMLQSALAYHKMAYEMDPGSIENVTRLAMVHYELGDWNEARRWYIKARDEMPERDAGVDDTWKGVAHTHLLSHFTKKEFSLPFA